MRVIIPSKLFMNDLSEAWKRGLNIKNLRNCVEAIVFHGKISEEYEDIQMFGRYEGFRQCRVDSEYMLLYRVDEEKVMLFRFKYQIN